MLKKSIYQWHRRLSLIIALPLVLSAGSGFMHPIMTNFRPSVATQGLRPEVIDSSQLRLTLQAALDSNHIDSISRFRVVHIDETWFYQVRRGVTDVPVYLSTRTGRRLPNGDWLYAQWLARQFLEGPGAMKGSEVTGERKIGSGAGEADDGRRGMHGNAAAGAAGATADGPVGAGEMQRGMRMAGMRNRTEAMQMTVELPSVMPDCCNAATASVLDAPGSKVQNVSRLTQFDEEYNEINRLLPVYKVSFNRPDGIRVYVETMQDRFSLAVDNRRGTFNKVFQFIHTYQWLDFLGAGKQVVEFLLMAIAFLTTVLGIYIFFSTRSKQVPGNGYVKARRNHRYTAIVISLFTLMFTFSGGYHALYKLKEDTRNNYFVKDKFAVRDLRLDYGRLMAAVRRPVIGISVVRMGGAGYWQVTTLRKAAGTGMAADGSANGKGGRKDLMKDMQVAAPVVTYVNVASGEVLPDGECRYAQYLATLFSGYPATDIVATGQITKFDRDYNFTDKRLPVWKVSYPENGHERYYVETATGSLSVRVNDWDLVEGYSFALLHKHEFLGGIGKWAKDTSTMFWAASQFFMVALGLFLYFRWVRKRQKNNTA